MKFSFQETQRIRQQNLEALHHQLRYASTEEERQAIVTQINFWRRQV
jgi:hypothetical protein